MKNLLVCVGNPQRMDDGAALKLGQLAALEGWPTLSCHQLTPELAPLLSKAERVVIADAVEGGQEPRLEPLQAENYPGWPLHCATPAALLGMCQKLYGHSPQSWILTLPGRDFGHGEGLSAAARRSVQLAWKMLCTS